MKREQEAKVSQVLSVLPDTTNLASSRERRVVASKCNGHDVVPRASSYESPHGSHRCLRGHTKLASKAFGAYPKSPSRLVEISASDVIDLILRNHRNSIPIHMKGECITLSHYHWGTAEIATLRQSGLDSMKEGINHIVQSSKKKSQDAVTATLCFNTRYLWIDSLCITQETSERTGERQSKSMNPVYKSSFLTDRCDKSR